MFLGHTNPDVWVSVNAIVLDSCKMTELRKKQLQVEILHNLEEFPWLHGLNFIWFQ